MQNGNIEQFSKLSDAKASCIIDDNCIGLYQDCNKGPYRLCNRPLVAMESGCGSTLHYVFGKQDISLHCLVFWLNSNTIQFMHHLNRNRD